MDFNLKLMEKIAHILQEFPELAVFLILFLGFALGHIKISAFKIGTVLGTLFAGVLIGQWNITIAPIVKAIFFPSFLFATATKMGFHFFLELMQNAFAQLILMVFISISCSLIAFGISKLLLKNNIKYKS